jgi:hypothetical protein
MPNPRQAFEACPGQSAPFRAPSYPILLFLPQTLTYQVTSRSSRQMSMERVSSSRFESVPGLTACYEPCPPPTFGA